MRRFSLLNQAEDETLGLKAICPEHDWYPVIFWAIRRYDMLRIRISIAGSHRCRVVPQSCTK